MTIGIARQEDRLSSLADEVGGDYKVCDITDPVRVKETADDILAEHPSVNVVVNNAGMALRTRFEDALEDDMMRAMETNFLGGFFVARALQPGLERAARMGQSADVINMVSAGAGITNPHSAPYGASKAAQLLYSRSLTTDLRPLGIGVHAILPGKADTEGHPQNPSRSPLSKVTGTDVDAVAAAVLDRPGKRPREVYVPPVLKWVAVANDIAPVTVTRVVNKLFS
jgi:NAD(P)-dependent dehydrogenase (short-subunit alcohol dehydrogenase family)